MEHPTGEKRISVNIAAYLAIILWAVTMIFQAGSTYATATMKAYIDERDEKITKLVGEKYDRLTDVIGQLRDRLPPTQSQVVQQRAATP